jgi:nitroreductase
MDIEDLFRSARSIRRFHESERPGADVLKRLVDAARLAPCGANLQLLRYTIIADPVRTAAVFPLLRWAAYLRDWDGPAEGERPPAYILLHAPVSEKPFTRIDAGIAAGWITLAARAAGLGSCMLLSFDSGRLAAIEPPPAGMSTLLVIALGIPAEQVVIDSVGGSGSIEYWRDRDGVHHVPKRKLDDIVVP